MSTTGAKWQCQNMENAKINRLFQHDLNKIYKINQRH